MTHYMELLATNQPWNLLIFMAVPIILAETLAITELYLLFTRNFQGWVHNLNRAVGIIVGLYFIGVIIYLLIDFWAHRNDRRHAWSSPSLVWCGSLFSNAHAARTLAFSWWNLGFAVATWKCQKQKLPFTDSLSSFFKRILWGYVFPFFISIRKSF